MCLPDLGKESGQIDDIVHWWYIHPIRPFATRICGEHISSLDLARVLVILFASLE